MDIINLANGRRRERETLADTIRKKIKVDDEYTTPAWAVDVILPYVPPEAKVWCPFDKEDSNYVRRLGETGRTVVRSHIEEEGGNFFLMDVPEGVDCIVSNPPYSTRDKVLARLYEIGLPFAMLMNTMGICDSKARVTLFTQYGVEFMYIYPRIRFLKNGKLTKANISQSAYVCWKLLPKELMIQVEENSIAKSV